MPLVEVYKQFMHDETVFDFVKANEFHPRHRHSLVWWHGQSFPTNHPPELGGNDGHWV